MPKLKKDSPTNKVDIADNEYNRLLEIYKSANVDAIKLQVYDKLLHKVAELYATLETIKDLPTILFNPNNPADQRETAAGKARVKYMAQYVNSMQKLNKELLGLLPEDDDDLNDYE